MKRFRRFALSKPTKSNPIASEYSPIANRLNIGWRVHSKVGKLELVASVYPKTKPTEFGLRAQSSFVAH